MKIMQKDFEIERLSSGYYILKMPNGQRILNSDYNQPIFEKKSSVKFFIRKLALAMNKGEKIPLNFMY